MTDYTIDSNITSSPVNEDLANLINTADTLTLNVTVNYGATVVQQSNCLVSSKVGGGSSTGTVTFVIKFINAGAFRLVIKNATNANLLFVTGTASGVTQAAGTGYGLQIFNPVGDVRMAVDKRQPRFHSFASGNGGTSSGSFTHPVYGYGYPSLSEWFAVQILPNSNFYVVGGATGAGPILERADVRSSTSSYQIFLGTDDYSLLVLRS